MDDYNIMTWPDFDFFRLLLPMLGRVSSFAGAANATLAHVPERVCSRSTSLDLVRHM